ncbi:classical arabinogalactan protein 9-like [Miscanthus floridulus]|uniref:classical arabinogalactan protein 9-like n=1 Tax=Miscanthus floridulus TaxID=154761 RepID=UPI00345B25B8
MPLSRAPSVRPPPPRFPAATAPPPLATPCFEMESPPPAAPCPEMERREVEDGADMWGSHVSEPSTKDRALSDLIWRQRPSVLAPAGQPIRASSPPETCSVPSPARAVLGNLDRPGARKRNTSKRGRWTGRPAKFYVVRH